MGAANINVRIDDSLKKQFEAFCNEVGISMSAAMTMFIKKTVKENRIPFSVGSDVPNAETIEAIEESRAILENPSAYKSYDDVDEMMKELLA